MNDLTQRQQALDITQSFIVQAPAGSGKTELLTQRYLKLLSLSRSPESVLAMTFTKKAVSELKTRVIESLQATQGKRPDEPHKQVTYDLASAVVTASVTNDWQLLDMPERLKITTIDGLSNLIVSRYPSENQPIAKQVIASTWEQADVYQQAAQQTLLLINDGTYQETVSAVLLYLDNHVQRFYRLITSMLAKRDQWLNKLYQRDVLDTKVLQDSAKKIIESHLCLLKKEAEKHLDVRFFALLSVNTLPELAKIQQLPAADLSALGSWIEIADLLLSGKSKKANKWRESVNVRNGFPPETKVQKNEFVQFLNNLQGKDAFRTMLFAMFSLPDVDFSIEQTKALKNIAFVLKLAVAQLNLLFEQQQKHDFIQVALDANQALGGAEVTDVALFLDNKIEHLLIDEFQDTNNSQFSLIENLIEHWRKDDGKTLFLVGDPMQSIYRFRESQVGLFLRTRVLGIANIKPVPLELSANFRSSRSIVEGNNQLFAKIFPLEEDIYKGAISYTACVANAKDECDNAIQFYPFAPKQYQLEAQKVVEIINRSGKHADIAILARNRSHLGDIIIALKQHNIEFETLKTTALKDNLFTRDLLALTQALLHLGDKLAWLSILRAPWCGLLLTDLLILAQRDKVIILTQLQDENILQQLSADGQKRACHLLNALQGALSQQSRFSFVACLSHALEQLLPKATLSAQQIIIYEQFLQIIHCCESEKRLTIDGINAMLDELFAPSKSANVKLMTIHESKGLEFDEVIIPGLGRRPKSDSSPIIHLQAFAKESLLIAPIKSYTDTDDSNTYTYLKFLETQQNEFEMMRLLYVAMTRAKKSIHLLGAAGKTGASRQTFLALLMPSFGHQFDDLTVVVDETPLQIQAPKLSRYKYLPEISPVIENANEQVHYQHSIEQLFKSLLGTLMHQYYEQTQFNPDKGHIENQLIAMGFPSVDRVQQIDFVLKLLDNTQKDKHFKWLFELRDSTQVEAEFIHQGKSIIIDRLFIDKGIVWIVDFKTATQADGETIAAFITRQQDKHSKQLLFYKTVLANIYCHPIRCVLYCPAVGRLIDIIPFSKIN